MDVWLPGLVIAPKQIDAVRIEYFVAGEKQYGFKRVITSVDVVSEKQVLAVGQFSAFVTTIIPNLNILRTS